MNNRITLGTPIFALLSGCAGLSPTLPPTVEAEPGAAYISGLFNRAKGANFAFVIRSVDGKVEYVMPMGEDNSLPTPIVNSTIAVKVTPGMYSISQWITYATMTKDVITRRSIENSSFSKPFYVAGGSVTHLGSFSIGSTTSIGGFDGYWHKILFDARIRPDSATTQEVRSAFIKSYPRLDTQPFICLFCSDSQ